jgi:hypothetical protein
VSYFLGDGLGAGGGVLGAGDGRGGGTVVDGGGSLPELGCLTASITRACSH